MDYRPCRKIVRDEAARARSASLAAMTEAKQLSPGDPAPDFDLADDSGGRVKLSELRGRKVLLYAYPAAMTPGCTTQAYDFRDSLDGLADDGFAVIGISPDPPDKLTQFREQEKLTFPLVSDPDKTVLRAYGAYGEKNSYGRTVVGVIRSTFVIDADGVISHAMYNVKAKGHVAKLRATLGL